MRLIILGAFMAIAGIIQAQTVKNVVGVQAGDNVLVTYDLLDNASKDYYVSLHYSIDGGITYSNELKQVSGDVKLNVKPGTDKKIIWDAEKELGSFAGEVIFKVDAMSGSRSSATYTAQNKCLKVDVNDVRRDGASRITLDFTVTPINGNSTIYLSAYLTNTYLEDQNGNKHKLSFGNLAGTPKGKDKAVLNGVPYQGSASFDGIPSNVFTANQVVLYIGAQGYQSGACAQNDELAAFRFKNVTIN